jgi:hypothetical protein
VLSPRPDALSRTDRMRSIHVPCRCVALSPGTTFRAKCASDFLPGLAGASRRGTRLRVTIRSAILQSHARKRPVKRLRKAILAGLAARVRQFLNGVFRFSKTG